MTQDEYRALIESVLDGMVEEGIFRVVGIDHRGRKCYALTAAVKVPHLIAKPAKAMTRRRRMHA